MKKILIADDSSETRKLIRYTLEREGYKVIEAKNGDEAIQNTSKYNPSLIILDIIMPVSDGFSTVLKLKNSKKTKNIPIIVMTGHEKLGGLFMMHETAKFNDFLEKPFFPEELVKKVKNILK